jgi:hypothetical protein
MRSWICCADSIVRPAKRLPARSIHGIASILSILRVLYFPFIR